ncbi:MAG: hypothetical protein M1812_002195 [Candelaria pacifica]|nr:MAG: hypothetical protein M1812_002195 [Candelaria pacifica]
MAATESGQSSCKTRRPKRKPSSSTYDEASVTVRNPPWAYIRLELITTPPSTTTLDAITARTHLTSALQQLFGLTGIAIPVDILKTDRNEVWIRVPREDSGTIVAAVGGWVSTARTRDEGAEQIGWKVKGASDWLANLVAGNGSDLFED